MPTPRFFPRVLAPPGTPAGDLLANTGGATALFPGSPATAQEWMERAGGGPARLAASAFHTTGPAATRKLATILDGGGVLVSTGQQPVLFGGPLLVLYKALGACVLAEVIEEAHGVPALPLFWVASDDHDWAEVGRVEVLDREGARQEVILSPPEGREGKAVGATPVPQEIQDRIDDMFQHLPQSEFSDGYLKLLRDAYRPGRKLGEAFLELVSTLLADRDLALLDSASEAVRSAARPLFHRVVREREAVAATLAKGEAAVLARGYEPQLHRRSGGIPLFADTERGRVRLLSTGENRIGEGPEGPDRSADEVLGAIESHPERFGPNVALRPVLESWMLPVAASILGPSEVAYWAELPPLFEWADVPLPAVVPRPSWSVVEGKIQKVLDKLDVGPEAFSDGGRALASRITEESLPVPVRSALKDARSDVTAAYGRLEEAVEAELPGVKASVGVARHGTFAAFEELERAVRSRVRERQSVLVEQITKAARHLYPDGQPQERVVSPFYFLTRYGSSFLAEARQAATAWGGDAAPNVAAPGAPG
jgi:bacillithiol biosynthesis cysteine-adding enzyme BshC